MAYLRFLTLFLFLLFVGQSYGYNAYLNKKLQKIINKGTVNLGDYTVISIPISYKFTLISTYYDYKKQGLEEREIILRLRKEFREWQRTGFPFVIVFLYKGNKRETGVLVPDDLADYVYLENTRGVKGRIKFQKVPIKRALNAYNRKVIVNLIFSTIDKDGNFLLNTSRLTLHIKDIIPGYSDVKISYPYPCRIDFSDAPPEIKRLLNQVVGSY